MACAQTGSRACSSPLKLPPGFRFVPTDEELILDYVKKKNNGCQLPLEIPTISPYKQHPRTLPAYFKYGKRNENYYFTELDMRDENGSRVRRAMDGGFWKMTGNNKMIRDSRTRKRIGFMKVFAFHEGSTKKHIKTNWIMHEFRYEPSVTKDTSSTKHKKKKITGYVLCRIYQKIGTPATPSNLEEVTDTENECEPMAVTEMGTGPIPQSIPDHSVLHQQATSDPPHPAHVFEDTLTSLLLNGSIDVDQPKGKAQVTTMDSPNRACLQLQMVDGWNSSCHPAPQNQFLMMPQEHLPFIQFKLSDCPGATSHFLKPEHSLNPALLHANPQLQPWDCHGQTTREEPSASGVCYFNNETPYLPGPMAENSLRQRPPSS